MVLRYNGASVAAAVMIASLESHGAHASRQISDTLFEWSCDSTADSHFLNLYEIRTPISTTTGLTIPLPWSKVENTEMTTREKVASVYIADTCATGECILADLDIKHELPQCRDCCEKRWAPYGKEFIEALDRAAWNAEWAERIAPCAFAVDRSEGRPKPAKGASELSSAQVKALGDLHEIVDAVALADDFAELDDGLQERILEKASVIFVETLLRLKHADLWRAQQKSWIDDPEKRCRDIYDIEFPAMVASPPAMKSRDSGDITQSFISPRFSPQALREIGSPKQSSFAFLWELGPSGKMDPGASSRKQEISEENEGSVPLSPSV